MRSLHAGSPQGYRIDGPHRRRRGGRAARKSRALPEAAAPHSGLRRLRAARLRLDHSGRRDRAARLLRAPSTSAAARTSTPWKPPLCASRSAARPSTSPASTEAFAILAGPDTTVTSLRRGPTGSAQGQGLCQSRARRAAHRVQSAARALRQGLRDVGDSQGRQAGSRRTRSNPRPMEPPCTSSVALDARSPPAERSP